MERDFENTWKDLSKRLFDGTLYWTEFFDIAKKWFPGELWVKMYALDFKPDNKYSKSEIMCLKRPFKHLPILELKLPPSEVVIETFEKSVGTICLSPETRFKLPMPLMYTTTDTIYSHDFFSLQEVPKELLGTNIKIGIIDTGLDVTHPDLKHIGEDNGVNFSRDNSLRDYIGHGTHCTSIINGRNDNEYSIAPFASIFFAKVFSADGYASLEGILSALEWTVEIEVEILSLSIGISDTTDGIGFLTKVCNDIALKYGTIIVAAAGNDGPELETIHSPADGKNVIAVGACDYKRQLAEFSSRGSPSKDHYLHDKPNVTGPGVNVFGAKSFLCDYPSYGADVLHTAISGTSMSTPAIAGLCSILCCACDEKDRFKRRYSVINALFNSCDPVIRQDGSKYESFEVGKGIPNIKKALQEIKYSPRQSNNDSAYVSIPFNEEAASTGKSDNNNDNWNTIFPSRTLNKTKILCELEEEIFAIWELRMMNNLPSLVSSLFDLKSVFFRHPTLEYERIETNKISEIKDYAVRYKWDENFINTLPKGKSIKYLVKANGKMIGGICCMYVSDMEKIAKGIRTVSTSLINIIQKQILSDSKLKWYFGFSGVFEEDKIACQQKTAIVRYNYNTNKWELYMDMNYPELSILFHPLSDGELLSRVDQYLNGTGTGFVHAEEVVNHIGINIHHLKFISKNLNGWKIEEKNNNLLFRKVDF